MAGLEVRESSGRGRGVFATQDFLVGALIEVCPVIALTAADRRAIDGTYLYNYYFGWGPDGSGAAFALGYGSLYNHSGTPNARYQKNLESGTISFFAIRRIAAGEEILITYNTGQDADLWFQAV